MRRQLAILLLIVLFGCGSDNSSSDNGGNGSLQTYKVLPTDTDSNMADTNKPHYAFVDTSKKLKGKLVVFFGGTNSAPSQYQAFPEAAASLGYHVIDLNYLNTITTLDCKDAGDMSCFTNYHEEIIFGNNVSTLVDVNETNCIVNRLLKLLQYLHQHHSQDGWGQFFTDNNILNYQKFVMAGHSQGGGHAAYLAYKFEVDRLIMFCSPADYSDRYSSPASWCTETFATPSARFYGLMHRRDDTVPPEDTHAVWQSMKLLVDADTSSADGNTYTSFRALSTNFDADATSTSHATHDVPVMDKAKPASDDYAHLKEVWNYLLGN